MFSFFSASFFLIVDIQLCPHWNHLQDLRDCRQSQACPYICNLRALLKDNNSVQHLLSSCKGLLSPVSTCWQANKEESMIYKHPAQKEVKHSIC